MTIWIGNIILLFVYALIFKLSNLNKKGRSILIFVVMFVQLMFLYTLKDHSIFNDLWLYLEGFQNSKEVGWIELYKIQDYNSYLTFELGWRYYTKLISSLSNNELIFTFLTGSFIIYSYFNFIKKYSLVHWFSIFLFISIVFYNSMFVLRQNLAIAICLFAIPYIIDRKLWKFLFVVGIAFLFHKTAFVFLGLYFIYPLKINYKFYIYLLAFFIIIKFVSLTILQFTVDAGFSADYLLEESRANITPFLISLSLVLFTGFILYPFKKIDKHEKLFFMMLCILMVFDLSRMDLFGTIGRLGKYLFPATIILIPNITEKINNPTFRVLIVILIIVLFSITSIQTLNYGFKLNI